MSNSSASNVGVICGSCSQGKVWFLEFKCWSSKVEIGGVKTVFRASKIGEWKKNVRLKVVVKTRNSARF
jgi:hypothetical protein